MSNKILLLNQIRDLLLTISKEIKNPQWNLAGSRILCALERTHIDFFHNEYTAKSGIRATDDMLICQQSQLAFPVNAPFLQGCIEFSRIKDRT